MLAQTGSILISSDDMAHGLFAPVMAGFFAWQQRDSILQTHPHSRGWGIPFLILAALAGVIATLGNSTTLARAACLISIVGCLILVGGFHAVRRLVFPLSLLLFTFPLPQVLYTEATQPLQLLATRLSEAAFELLGFSVMREGNIIELPHQHLSIIEACSGLRSLITLGFFCLTYAYAFEKSLWLRAFIALIAIPSAILLNVVRITVTGILGESAPEYTHGIYHSLLGWACLGIAFGVVYLLHQLVKKALGVRSLTAAAV